MNTIKGYYLDVRPFRKDALHLPVSNLEDALPFYQEILSLLIVSRTPGDPERAVLQRDKIRIGLVANGDDPSTEGCFFAVENLENAVYELRYNGLKDSDQIFKIETHGNETWKTFYLTAPDGLCFCLGEKVEEPED